MKKCLYPYNLALLGLLITSLFSCKSDPDQINFTINGQSPQAFALSDAPPQSLDDPNQVVVLTPSDSVIVVADATLPADKVKKRGWDFSSDGISDTSSTSFSLTLPGAGLYPIALTVNGKKTIVKYVYLPEPPAPIDSNALVVTPPPPPPPSKRTPPPSRPAPRPTPMPVPVKVAPPPPPPPPPANAEPEGRPGVAAYPASGRSGACGEAGIQSATITIRPRQPIEMESFTVFSNACGRLDVSIQGGGLNETQNGEPLNKGRTQVRIDDVILQPGQTYTLTVKPRQGTGSCNTQPLLESAADCKLTPVSHPALDLVLSGAPVLFDFKFKF